MGARVPDDVPVPAQAGPSADEIDLATIIRQ
jgi:hypothetical protein